METLVYAPDLLVSERAGNLLQRVPPADRLVLSARGLDRVRRLARTIADLAGSMPTGEEHVAEALALREAW